MTRTAIDEYLYLLDGAFTGSAEQPWHSLLGNLASVREGDWLWTPPGGARSIRALTAHVGAGVHLYDDRVFGNYAVFGDPIAATAPAGDLGHDTEELEAYHTLLEEPPMAAVIAWVSERHNAFRDAVAGLEDTALSDIRWNHHGLERPIRWFITTMIQHYSYHAGEINHIRALHQGNDHGS